MQLLTIPQKRLLSRSLLHAAIYIRPGSPPKVGEHALAALGSG
jgi:hypothetical protein